MSFAVEVTEDAQADIQRIFDWLSTGSPQGAQNWWYAVRDSIARLNTDALLFSVHPSGRSIGIDFRVRPFSTSHGRTYQIVYEINPERTNVRVLRVRTPGQRPVRRRDLN